MFELFNTICGRGILHQIFDQPTPPTPEPEKSVVYELSMHQISATFAHFSKIQLAHESGNTPLKTSIAGIITLLDTSLADRTINPDLHSKVQNFRQGLRGLLEQIPETPDINAIIQIPLKTYFQLDDNFTSIYALSDRFGTASVTLEMADTSNKLRTLAEKIPTLTDNGKPILQQPTPPNQALQLSQG